MRLIPGIAFFIFFGSPLLGQEAEISLDIQNARLPEVLVRIEAQSNYRFFYSNEEIIYRETISLKVQNIPLTNLLDRLFKDTDISYRVIGNQIVLRTTYPEPLPLKRDSSRRAIIPEKLVEKWTNIQKLHVPVLMEGRVWDARTGEALIGVNVYESGTTKGTITDKRGFFSLQAGSRNSEIVFSYVGYDTKTLTAATNIGLQVYLEPKNTQLEEVVLIGYGSQKKSDLTGAVSSIRRRDLSNTHATSIDQAIQGLSAGVLVTQSSGRPGSPVSVKIRGVGTVNNSEPLFIVDGIPIVSEVGAGTSQNPLSLIDPGDIESVEILKDASATSIYGSRGANGVILIRTRRASKQGVHISFHSSTGASVLPRKTDLLDAQGYLDYIHDLYTRGNLPDNPVERSAAYRNPIMTGQGTRWQDVITQRALQHNSNLIVSSRAENSEYSIAGSYLKQEGILRGTGLERFTFRSSASFNLGSKLKLGGSFLGTRTLQDRESQGFFNAYLASPLMPVYDDRNRGGYAGPSPVTTGENTVTNVLAENLLETRQLTNNRFLGSLYGELEILQGLIYRFDLSGDLAFLRDDQFFPEYDLGANGTMGIRGNPISVSYQSKVFRYLWVTEQLLQYSANLNKHHFTLMTGYSAQAYQSESLNASARNFPDPLLTLISEDRENLSAEENISEWKLISQYGRLLYNFDDKYLLQFSLRRDGSSRFGPKNRWGVFPAFSAGWRIGEEARMQSVSWVDELKLRFGWGRSGNQEIGNYGYFTEISTDRTFYVFGTGQQTYFGGTPLLNFGNRNIRWETTSQTNFGMDLGFFDNELFLTADYYIKDTDGMLVRLPLSGLAGLLQSFAEPYVNIGRIRNRGLELELGYHNNVGKFRYTLSGNFSTLKNEVLFLRDNALFGGKNNETITREGHAIGNFYGYVSDGIFQDAEEVARHAYQSDDTAPGDIRFLDLNKDGRITGKDRTSIGKALPDIIYGLQLNLNYSNWDMAVYLQGIAGNDLYNEVRRNIHSPSNLPFRIDHNKSKEVLNYWTPENRDTDIPRIRYNDENANCRVSSLWVEDGSYLRIKTMQVGYSLNEPVLRALSMQKVRFYLASQNLLTLTAYSGIDPEIGSSSPVGFGGQPTLDQGIDDGKYPQPRTVMVGVQVEF